MTAVGARLSTVWWSTGDDAVRLPASLIETWIVCEPSISFVVSQGNVNVLPTTVGTTVVANPSTISLPASGAAPPVTVAVTGTVLLANVQSRGTVTTTVGGPLPIANGTDAEVFVLPALSTATLVSVCAPFARPARISVAE